MENDCYANAVAYLTENPNEIQAAWNHPTGHLAGCLFKFVSRSGRLGSINIGCLTQIRACSGTVAFTPELTTAIREDTRLPNNEYGINVSNLEYFAEWQRRIDKERERLDALEKGESNDA